MRKNTRFVPRPKDGTYSRPIGPIPDPETTSLVLCEACNKHSRQVVWVKERTDQELYPLCGDCDHPHRAGVDQAEEWLLALDDNAELIRTTRELLSKLHEDRVELVKDCMHLAGISATEVAGRLGISRRRVYKMIEQPQGPVSDPGPELF